MSKEEETGPGASKRGMKERWAILVRRQIADPNGERRGEGARWAEKEKREVEVWQHLGC